MVEVPLGQPCDVPVDCELVVSPTAAPEVSRIANSRQRSDGSDFEREGILPGCLIGKPA